MSGKCTCHERDSSWTCKTCKADGYYGDMEEPKETHVECDGCCRWVKKGLTLCKECKEEQEYAGD